MEISNSTRASFMNTPIGIASWPLLHLDVEPRRLSYAKITWRPEPQERSVCRVRRRPPQSDPGANGYRGRIAGRRWSSVCRDGAPVRPCASGRPGTPYRVRLWRPAAPTTGQNGTGFPVACLGAEGFLFFEYVPGRVFAGGWPP